MLPWYICLVVSHAFLLECILIDRTQMTDVMPLHFAIARVSVQHWQNKANDAGQNEQDSVDMDASKSCLIGWKQRHSTWLTSCLRSILSLLKRSMMPLLWKLVRISKLAEMLTERAGEVSDTFAISDVHFDDSDPIFPTYLGSLQVSYRSKQRVFWQNHRQPCHDISECHERLPWEMAKHGFWWLILHGYSSHHAMCLTKDGVRHDL